MITLFGVLAVYLTYRIARRVTDKRTALLAAYLVATSFLLVHLGKPFSDTATPAGQLA